MKVFYFKRVFLLVLATLIVYTLGFLAGRLSWRETLTTGLIAKEMPIFYVKKNLSEVCLTFDISWGEQTLPRVLKILEQQQIQATFFLSGPWTVRNPDAARSIVANGHEIASHGDRHLNLSRYPREVVEENISKARRDLLSVVKRVAPFFRPPNGDYDDLVIDTARKLGFETVIWAIDSLDWKNPGPDYMVGRILKRAFPGAIILCHASDSSKEIHLALPGIINGLRAKGYKFVTLSELMRNGIPGRNDPR